MLYNVIICEIFTDLSFILHYEGGFMLIEFTVGNYRSFKDPVTLSMVAAKLNSKYPEIDESNTFQAEQGLTLLSSAAIYGANASGKSNLIRAFQLMRDFIQNSSKESLADEPIHTTPFRLDSKAEHSPSYFEVVFRLDGIRYRYGFEITTEKVEAEWLFYSPKGKESKLFTREGNDISFSRAFKGNKTALISLTRPNALFLSVAAQFNNEIATKVLGWFLSVNVISGLDDTGYRGFTTMAFAKNKTYREKIIQFIRGFDVGIDSIIIEKAEIPESGMFPKDLPQELKDFFLKQIKEGGEMINFRPIHRKLCENGALEETKFDLTDESEGTQKLFYLSGPIIDTLIGGKVLFIDEIEARLHPLLTRKLIGLFHSKELNPNHAQLIFATHDTNLLSNKLFRRDQIWFVEKDEEGASHLYSLAELKVRNDASFGSEYLQGRYGAIPIFGEFKETLTDFEREDHQDEA